MQTFTNGINLRETNKSPEILNRTFEIDFFDNTFIKKHVFLELKNVSVVNLDNKRMWIYLVKNDYDFYQDNRLMFGNIIKTIHPDISQTLHSRYGFCIKFETVLIDHINTVF